MENSSQPFWRKCSSCKKSIGFRQKYWVCSVSTCNRLRTGLIFCSVSCVDAHIPMMNHRDAGAFEKLSPTQSEFEREAQAEKAAVKFSQPTVSTPNERANQQQAHPAGNVSQRGENSRISPNEEILTVVSKVKAYIRERSGLSTSDAVMERLSSHIRRWADEAVRRAAQDQRQTVMDRDIR